MVKQGFSTNLQGVLATAPEKAVDSPPLNFADQKIPFDKAVALYMARFDVDQDEAGYEVALERGEIPREYILDGITYVSI